LSLIVLTVAVHAAAVVPAGTGGRDEFVQHSKLLAHKIAGQGSHSSDVAARPIKAGDQTLLNRIGPKTEDDRNCVSCSFGCTGRKGAAESHYHAHPTVDQVGGEFPQVQGPAIERRSSGPRAKRAGAVESCASRAAHRLKMAAAR
jgi:hypothetical protein